MLSQLAYVPRLMTGLAVAALSLQASLGWALVCLAIMGAADTISKIMRMALVQHHTPDYLLGRVSSLWMTQYSLGQALGNLQMGYLARLLGPAVAVAAGGLACAAVACGFGVLNQGLRSVRNQDGPPHA